MNCAEYQELLVAYLEGLLDDSQKQAIEEHVKQCDTCRTQLQELQTLQQRLVDSGKALAQSDLEDQVMNRILREQSARLKSAAPAGTGLRLRRLIMKSSTIKIAVAAAVILAAIAGISLWTGTKSGVALADVLAKMEQVQAFMYRVDIHSNTITPGMIAPLKMDMSMTMLIAADYGARVDVRLNDPLTGQPTEEQLYLLPEQKMMLRLMPAKKQYERQKLDGPEFEEMKKQNKDPRLLVQRFLECQYQDLGRTRMDGVEAQGFRTTDPSSTGGLPGETTLWVDGKTGLPVRIDMKLKVNEQSEAQSTLYDFQWDVPVTADQFRPVVPPDFTPGLSDGTKAVSMTEQGAIDGLRFCVEFGEKYPESLELAPLMLTIQSFQNSQTPAAKKFMEGSAQAKTPDEIAAKAREIMTPLQSLGMFYASLVKDKKEPVYYGKVAQPGDIAQVLLRWKTGENEYRVIFADLHAATVNADTLAKLEAGLPK
jgi:outer membrane lipoprotein-sorting protein